MDMKEVTLTANNNSNTHKFNPYFCDVFIRYASESSKSFVELLVSWFDPQSVIRPQIIRFRLYNPLLFSFIQTHFSKDGH